MSTQRTPPPTKQTEEMPTDLNICMETQSEALTAEQDDHTPPSYVFLRNRRPREEELSPSQFLDFKQEMTKLITTFISSQQKSNEDITNSLKSLQQTTSNIEQNISLLTTQNQEFQKKIERLETQAKKDREYITTLEDKIEEQQRTARKASIELKNVPRKPSENRSDLLNMITCLSKTINMDLSVRDIKDIYRIKVRNDKESNPPIIVELGSTILRTDLLKKTKEFNVRNKCKLQAKHLGFTTSEDAPVFISEQLTAKAARLFFLSRDLVRSNKYKYCWTAFGKVLVRKDDQSKIIWIQHEAQVNQLLQET